MAAVLSRRTATVLATRLATSSSITSLKACKTFVLRKPASSFAGIINQELPHPQIRISNTSSEPILGFAAKISQKLSDQVGWKWLVPLGLVSSYTVVNSNWENDSLLEKNTVGEPTTVHDEHEGQHPRMSRMCVMNCEQQSRIFPNSAQVDISNDTFEGKLLLLIRTPDLDTGDQSGMDDFPKRVSNYFKGKKRRFEFQFQIKLKRIPTGPLFLGCELARSIQMSTITKRWVDFLLFLVRTINPGFHYSRGPDASLDAADKDAGVFEQTHISFPVEASMDRIVITKPGEKPPVLGSEFYESNESVKRRRRTGAGSVDWNLEDTYTMCLWSVYADWIDWRSLNVPGVAPFSLCRVTGNQPIYLCVYEITSCTPTEYRKQRGVPHLQKDLNIFTRLEFSNAETTVGGFAQTVLGR